MVALLWFFFVLCLFFIPTVFRTLDTVCIHVINISWSHEPEKPCVFLSICYKSKCSSFYYISKLLNSLKCLHVALQLSRLAEINRSGLYFSWRITQECEENVCRPQRRYPINAAALLLELCRYSHYRTCTKTCDTITDEKQLELWADKNTTRQRWSTCLRTCSKYYYKCNSTVIIK